MSLARIVQNAAEGYVAEETAESGIPKRQTILVTE
jgi:hypothetical protein